MVASLSVGRPKYAAHAAVHERASAEGTRLAGRFLEIADEDAAAYGGFAAAMKLPRETDEERAARTRSLRSAARSAAEVPLGSVGGVPRADPADLSKGRHLGSASRNPGSWVGGAAPEHARRPQRGPARVRSHRPDAASQEDPVIGRDRHARPGKGHRWAASAE